MHLSLFDFHCDTAYEMLRKKQPLAKNELAVSLEQATVFERYIQVMALWTDYGLDDEAGWTQCLAMLENLKKDPSVQNREAQIATAVADDSRPTLLIGVEDGRILAEKIERVEQLYKAGIRIFTPLWKGKTCLGGAHDTAEGLTAFGKAAIAKCVALGIVPDISHASEASAEDIFEIADANGSPVIASHSNAYDICPVSRNLRKSQIRNILRSDGIIGINLFRAFLKEDGNAAAKDILPHIEFFLEQGAEDALCIGGDMDGCDLPEDIPNLAALPRLAELLLCHRYSEAFIHKLFYQNAWSFAHKHIH